MSLATDLIRPRAGARRPRRHPRRPPSLPTPGAALSGAASRPRAGTAGRRGPRRLPGAAAALVRTELARFARPPRGAAA